MGTIIAFRAASGAGSARTDRQEAGRHAEVVVFPGVRYERRTDQTATPTRRGGRRRDELELDD